MNRPALVALLGLVLLAPACARDRASDEPPPAAAAEDEPSVGPPRPAAPVALPAGFRRVGRPVLFEAYLPPAAAWREAVSRLSELRAEARSAGEDLLVTFETNALVATSRSGLWRRWELPEGLSLEGVPAHLLLGADLGLTAFGPDGAQIPDDKEVAVVTARAVEEGEPPREFRLVVKAGATFRSISIAG